MQYSIRTHLLLLVAALSVPLAIALGYTIYSGLQNAVGQTKASLNALVGTIATSTGRQIQAGRQTLERLAARPLVRRLDPARCDPLLRDLQAINPSYVNIMTTDLAGRVVCSAQPLPGGRPVSVAAMPWFRKLLEDQRFQIGEPHVSQITGRMVAPFSLPIVDDAGRPIGSINLPFDLSAFDPKIPIEYLPPDSRYGLFHENGVLLWRNADPENAIGTRPRSQAARDIVAVRDGVFESVALDGRTRYFSARPVPEIGLVAYVGVLKDSIDEPALRRAAIGAIIGLVGLLALILIARAIARRIEQPIASLADTARAVRAGNETVRATAYGPVELAAVASEFNAMLDARQLDENRLRASEERLTAFLDNSAVIAWLKDEQGRYVFASNNMLGRFGLEARDILGKTDHDVWPHNIAEQFRLNDLAVLAGADHVDEAHSFESVERALNPDGSVSWWLANKFVFTDSAGRRHIGGLSVDITERERAREELVEASQFNSQIVDSAQEGIVVYGADLHYRVWNPYMERFTGMTAADVIGRHPLEVFPFLRDGGVMTKLAAALDGVIAEPVEFPFEVKQTGRSGWASDRTAPLFNARGEVVGVMATVRDVTEHVYAEARLRELNESLESRVRERTADLEKARLEAERLARTKSEFLANMSHEIRTPLNGVLGMAEVGYRRATAPEVRRAFGQIIGSGKLLLGVINDILDFSKIEAGKLRVDNQPTDPAQCVEHAVALVGENAAERRIGLRVERAPDLPAACLIDGLRLEQVLLNLLSNAIKFTEEGEVVLRARRDGDRLVFAVSDTGLGMDQEQLSRLFRPFEQADSSTTRRFGGTGLGLAIIGRIVELMGGAIRVDSAPGRGSTFEVRLPLVEIDPATLRAGAGGGAASADRLSGVRVLVAEDNEVNRAVIEGLLAGERATVACVANGRQAVDAVIDGGPDAFDIVLMDIQMPLMNGYDAARKILRLAPDLPIVALTAHALPEERERCLQAGMVDQATKPIAAEQLIGVVLRASGRAPNAPGAAPPDAGSDAAAAPLAGRIDWRALESTYAATPAMVPRLLASFVRSGEGRAAAIRAAAEAGELHELEVHAHGLKSAFGFLKADRPMATARELEAAAKAGDSAEAGRLAAQLANQLADELDAVLGEIAGRSA